MMPFGAGDLPQAPAWAWVTGEDGKVLFAGCSNVGERPHPWLHDAKKAHVLIAGHFTIDPLVVVETDQFQGWRIDQLVTAGIDSRDVEELVAKGGRLLR